MTEAGDQPRTRWAELSNGSGADYAARFAALAATGKDVHGEASFCSRLVAAPARILDAGCGTGRVAIRLAELGYRCVGVDLDESMLEQARQARPDLVWIRSSIETVDTAGDFDLVVAAGNVVPLLAAGTLNQTMANLARALRPPDALLVTGFGLDRAHLPRGCPVTTLADYDAAAEAAGLRLLSRFPGWDGPDRGDPVRGYAVSVHRLVRSVDIPDGQQRASSGR